MQVEFWLGAHRGHGLLTLAQQSAQRAVAPARERDPGTHSRSRGLGGRVSFGRLESCTRLGLRGCKSPGVPLLRILLGGTSSGCFCVTALWINCSVERDIWDPALGSLLWLRVGWLKWGCQELSAAPACKGAEVPTVTVSDTGTATARVSSVVRMGSSLNNG